MKGYNMKSILSSWLFTLSIITCIAIELRAPHLHTLVRALLMLCEMYLGGLVVHDTVVYGVQWYRFLTPVVPPTYAPPAPAVKPQAPVQPPLHTGKLTAPLYTSYHMGTVLECRYNPPSNPKATMLMRIDARRHHQYHGIIVYEYHFMYGRIPRAVMTEHYSDMLQPQQIKLAIIPAYRRMVEKLLTQFYPTREPHTHEVTAFIIQQLNTL